MHVNSPQPVEFRSIKQLINRFNASRDDERDMLISTDEFDVPSWQRQIVWTDDDMGLLAYSIVQNYPIGMIILWRKDDDIRVPIDGRQRLTAIRRFFEGQIAIPDLPGVDDEFQKSKFKLLEGDEDKGFRLLDMKYRDVFEDYEPSIFEYAKIDEATAMDIFVKLQGGKSLTKTEVRAALGGKLCDFVTELTNSATLSTDESDEEEPLSRHTFFQRINLRNVRKAHRNLCDVLLHEVLYPDQDKHWTSLETMYRDKATSFSETEEKDFRTTLGRFQRAVEFTESGQKKILPQLRSTFLILTYFKAWKEITERYALPQGFSFAEIVSEFETLRATYPDEIPWVNFNAALSNAGYAQVRVRERHKLLMSHILRKYPGLVQKDDQRTFTEAQKIAIWDRADKQCEWLDEDDERCPERFADFREAEADHFIKWSEGGPTTVENGRLLCQYHNRSRR